MKRAKTADLIGAALDWAVAKANGWVDYPKDSIEHGAYWYEEPDRAPFGRRLLKELCTPSTEWSQGGPIIERGEIDLYCHESPKTGGGWWVAEITGTKAKAKGNTPLIAAMRCYVASKLGDEVEIPEELLP